MNRKKIKSVGIYTGIAILVVLLNLLAWYSNRFCDAYIMYVFPVWVNTYGRFSGIFPFSIGEWLLALGVILVCLAVIFGLFFILAKICLFFWKKESMRQAGGKICGACRVYYRFFAWVLLFVCLVMTLNCLILYHASTFSEKYFGGGEAEYDLQDVMLFRNSIVAKCNELSKQMEREETGRIIYTGSMLSDGNATDLQGKAVEAMKNLGKGISYGEQTGKLRAYSQLDGFYPRPKAMLFSDFMCQQYMQGYYFPFSMEANYNDVMYVMNKPFTMCHELAHLRGYIFEDEANFIGYLACVQSDDIYFQYSGYLCAFSYLENDLYKAKNVTPNAYAAALEEVELLEVDRQVYADNIFVEAEEWDRINAKALLSTETVDKAADVFIDTNLKVNGVEDGALSYNRLVKLLMLYYEE